MASSTITDTMRGLAAIPPMVASLRARPVYVDRIGAPITPPIVGAMSCCLAGPVNSRAFTHGAP
jgi:hypothetical protein